ncbi:MAG: hypothetical protein M3386_01535 [Actinomycetota bacterium]|nr:hypothetical protein [Actinomycetota bacterium]
MIVTLLEYAAWIISAVLVAWMVFDAVKVSREYPEDYLISRGDLDDVGLEDGRV